MEKNYYTRYYMKIQNVIAVTASIINIIVYLFESLSHFVGGNIQKLEIIQNSFDFYDDTKFKRNLTYVQNEHQGSAINIQNLSGRDLNDIQFKFDSIIKKPSNKNFQSSLFCLTNKDTILNKSKDIKIKINLPKFNYSKDKIETLNNQISNNINIKLSSIEKNTIEQSGNQLLQRLKNPKHLNSNIHSYLDSEEELSLSYMILENLKINLLFCCYSNKRFSRIFNTQNSTLLHWYYVYLVQSSRYLEMVKQFEFMKKLLLNEGQINSLLLLKKINLKNEEERDNLITIKNNDVENSVVSYFKNIIKNDNISKTDIFIFENLNKKVKNKII